ncbi:tetratricopeptide repeat protein [Marinobacter halodurans]|uniref:Tetratricopeptide repeat protein n=1 Tax=Marinobacter halodurans TaxID=2528979 RepID=A0ABY1ZKY0_9GAMM|nr:M48 family metalloprotease [Marinobacter halodurans]TBW54670.1 tetratricopeptide repeat protein [Marinobacter halodurans]
MGLLLALGGCAVNPVTGERQLSLISESQEMAMGAEQYKPTVQLQGGQYQADPELTDYVQQVGQKLAAVSDRPDLPYEFVILNSSVPNAWALPSGKIAVNRGLLTRLEDEAQLASVLGHEIVHAAARHSVQRMQQGMILNAGIAGLGIALSDNDYASLIMGGAALGSQLTMAQYSQSNELEADHYGVKYMAKAGYDPQAAVELQEIFVKLAEGHNSSWVDGLFASHPPSRERVQANQQLVDKLGDPGGYRGEQVYDNKLAYLRSKQPAYDAQEEAVKLANEGNLDAAINKLDKAIRIEPKDPSFYALRGQILKKQGKQDAAQQDFDKAVSLYPDMFSYHLYRGLGYLDANKLSAARTDLETANKVVPTAIAYLRLGDIAVKQNRREEAAQYYSAVAQTDSELAKEAQQKLAALQR